MKKISLGILVLALAACTMQPAADEADTAFRDRDWQLAWVEGFDTMPSGVATPTIRFGSDGSVSAKTGCNSAGASYKAEGDRLTLDAIFSTKRACLDPNGNALEAAYLGALEKTRAYRIANGKLELLDAGNTVVARFQ